MHTRLHRAAAASYVALILLLVAWVGWLAPPPAGLRSLGLIVLVAPLLLALRGILHRRRYTLAWSTLLILAYFAHGVAAAAGTGISQLLGYAELVLSLAYFGLTTALLRLSRAPP